MRIRDFWKCIHNLKLNFLKLIFIKIMKIQYISDIHLEFYEDILQIPIIPSAPVLCLLGDIS